MATETQEKFAVFLYKKTFAQVFVLGQSRQVMTKRVWEPTEITCTSHKLGARIKKKSIKFSYYTAVNIWTEEGRGIGGMVGDCITRS